MKKLISLITVFILTSATVFESDAEDLAALLDRSGELRSASAETTVKTDPPSGGRSRYLAGFRMRNVFEGAVKTVNGDMCI